MSSYQWATNASFFLQKSVKGTINLVMIFVSFEVLKPLHSFSFVICWKCLTIKVPVDCWHARQCFEPYPNYS